MWKFIVYNNTIYNIHMYVYCIYIYVYIRIYILVLESHTSKSIQFTVSPFHRVSQPDGGKCSLHCEKFGPQGLSHINNS